MIRHRPFSSDTVVGDMPMPDMPITRVCCHFIILPECEKPDGRFSLNSAACTGGSPHVMRETAPPDLSAFPDKSGHAHPKSEKRIQNQEFKLKRQQTRQFSLMSQSKTVNYLGAYSSQVQQQVQALLDNNKTGPWLLKKYPQLHALGSEKALYEYAQGIKNEFMRSSSPISKVVYDDKIHVINNALGLHTYVSRVQGNKLKAKHEIRISSLFRKLPEPLLRMILVHELAHLREKNHDKAFYKLCCYMEPDYHQLEFDLRVYLSHRDRYGELWT
jgi:UTP pyrophosphatase